MGREAKDTIGIQLGTKENPDVREIMPLRKFALSELTSEQVTELVMQALKIRDGILVRSAVKKLLPKIQMAKKIRRDLESIPGMTPEMLTVMYRNPEYSIDLPGQLEFSLSDYFGEEATETETAEEVKEETKEEPKKNGKGKK
jgi:hypothetical protein